MRLHIFARAHALKLNFSGATKVSLSSKKQGQIHAAWADVHPLKGALANGLRGDEVVVGKLKCCGDEKRQKKNSKNVAPFRWRKKQHCLNGPSYLSVIEEKFITEPC